MDLFLYFVILISELPFIALIDAVSGYGRLLIPAAFYGQRAAFSAP